MTDASNHEPMRMPVARRKLLRAQRSTLLFGAGLALVALVPWRVTRAPLRWLVVISRALLAVWGVLSIPMITQLLRPGPMVVINDAGIRYHPMRVGPFTMDGALTWEHIQALYIANITLTNRYGLTTIHRSLCVLPKDIGSFLQPMNILNKTLRSLVMTQTGSPFVIPDALLPISADELLASICTRYQDVIARQEIELRPEVSASISTSRQAPVSRP